MAIERQAEPINDMWVFVSDEGDHLLFEQKVTGEHGPGRWNATRNHEPPAPHCKMRISQKAVDRVHSVEIDYFYQKLGGQAKTLIMGQELSWHDRTGGAYIQGRLLVPTRDVNASQDGTLATTITDVDDYDGLAHADCMVVGKIYYIGT